MRSEIHPEGGRAGKGPIWVSQMWTDFLAVGVDRNENDRQPNAPLLELWRQLRREQQFTKFGKHPQQETKAVQLKDDMALKDVPLDDVLFHFE